MEKSEAGRDDRKERKEEGREEGVINSLRSSRFRFLQAKRGKRVRALGKKEQKSRSGGEGRGRKGNACR